MIGSRLRRQILFALVGVASLLSAAPAAAQLDDLDRVEFGVGVAGWTGAQADRFEPGLRGVLGLQVDVGSRRHIGFEVLYGRFEPDEPGTAVQEVGIAFTGRRAVDGLGASTPYLQARFGVHRLDGTMARSDARQLGLRVGPEIGVLVPSGREGLEVLAAFEVSWLWYADGSVGEIPVEDSGGYAVRWGLRVGVSIDPSR